MKASPTSGGENVKISATYDSDEESLELLDDDSEELSVDLRE